ncbi:BnaA05g17200D [Brassica napus]|uniref:BnaA05g17200D protein n=1 Tax=Brassica napus TaxID=3708 RepID=A0A078FCC2_BRANA|nr:BnaA05g17200D [Brassica napus]
MANRSVRCKLQSHENLIQLKPKESEEPSL